MSKQAIDAKRGTMFMLEPERLTLVYDKAHPLYDPRVEDEPPESMISNIAMNGVLEPVIVRKNGNAIEVVAGRGRTKATLEANRRLVAEGKLPIFIPCILKGGTDADLFGIMVSENEIRREDTMIVKGMKARKLLNLGYLPQQIAVTFGVTRQAVDNWLAADELPQEIKDAVESGEISATAAAELAKGGQSKDEQVKQFEDLKKEGKKPTVHNVSANPKVKRRKEIQARYDEMYSLLLRKEKPSGYKADHTEGYLDALEWVLGEDEEEAEDGA